MDTQQQPMIKTDAIILIEGNFIRYPENPNIMDTSVQISYEHNINDEGVGNGFLTLNISGVSKETNGKVFDARVRYLGIFIADHDTPNMSLDEFLRFHAPAHIYPYVREFVTTLSTRSGIPPIILPPVNIAAVLKVEMTGELQKTVLTPVINESTSISED